MQGILVNWFWFGVNKVAQHVLRRITMDSHFHRKNAQFGIRFWIRVNDPSAGSPTETLLRLLLPLNDKV